MTKSDFEILADLRLVDARALFEAKQFDGAYYLAGYAVECALKACIAKLTQQFQFPLAPDAAREIYTHDFGKLLKAAGLQKEVEQAWKADAILAVRWDVVKDWKEESRYHRNGIDGRKKAEDMIEAVADPDHGVLQCIKKFW